MARAITRLNRPTSVRQRACPFPGKTRVGRVHSGVVQRP